MFIASKMKPITQKPYRSGPRLLLINQSANSLEGCAAERSLERL